MRSALARPCSKSNRRGYREFGALYWRAGVRSMPGMSDGQFAAALRARVAAAASAPAYETYRSVLSHVLRLKDALGPDGGTGRPSDLWAEDLANMEYLLDASPLLVEKLRHHTYHITGLYVYDYR